MTFKGQDRMIELVLVGHYLSAFTSLGMPLFLPVILPSIARSLPAGVYGVFYVLPTVLTALFAPAWGKISDRYGYRLSLQRAYGGLAAGFLIAGLSAAFGYYALVVFTFGLIVQGICGGAMAASNAYLASQLTGEALRKALNWTQFSARLSMLTAPWIIGFMIDGTIGVTIYLWLALLPLLALLGSFLLPYHVMEKQVHLPPDDHNSLLPSRFFIAEEPLYEMKKILLLQGLFSFSVVVTFPYFISYCHVLGLGSNAWIGFLYGMPHLVYMIGMVSFRHFMPTFSLKGGLSFLALGCFIQGIEIPLWLLMIARMMMGIGIFFIYMGLHHALGTIASTGSKGVMFGRFDAIAKWAGAIAGLVAGCIVQFGTVFSPFLIAGGVSLYAALLAFPIFKSVEESA